MLVLTRRKNEVILIGEHIRLRVVSIGRSSVRLAIEAPREVPVHRREVRQRIDAERFITVTAAEIPAEGVELVSA